MKKLIYKTIVFIFTLGVFTSCEDNLDQTPFDAFSTENAFITAEDFETGIRGVYEALVQFPVTNTTTRASGIYGSPDNGSMLSAPDVLADNVTMAEVGNGRNTKRFLHEYTYSSGLSMTTQYRDSYALIYRANQILQFSAGFDGSNKANIEAEAKALRALAHFNLVSYWGKIPTQSGDANSSLGVAYVFDADPNLQPSRNTVGEVYNLIVADLTDAMTGINSTNPEGRMNKQAVATLLSRVYLYMGQWQNVIDTANQVTTSIASRDSFVGIWDDTNADGLIFSIPNQSPVLGNQIGITWNQGLPANLVAEYVASFELTNLFAADDIRKEAYIFDATAAGSPINGIRKLFARPGENDGVVDYKIFRASEAALNKAEAYFNLGQEGLALAELNKVRSRRYLTPADGETGTTLRDAIRLERRLEFAFEYQRFFDIKRLGLSVQRGSQGDVADGSGTPSTPLTLAAGSNKFQLPFAQTTLDQNPNITQNPGY